jgi:hypothetical protein
MTFLGARGRRKLKGSQLPSSPLEAKIFDHPVLIEEDDQAIHFLLFPRVLKYGKVGEIGFFNREDRRVLLKIGIDKDVSVKLLLNLNRRSKGLKNFTLGGGTDPDLFTGIVFDLGSLIDPSDSATTCQGHQERDENKYLITIRQSLYESHNILPFLPHRKRSPSGLTSRPIQGN